jgi:putative tricarboxylic transport membrane protein
MIPGSERTIHLMRHNRATSLFLLAFALFFSFESYQLGMGTLRDPGRGFIPFMAGILLAALAIGILAQSVANKEQPSSFGKGWRKGCWVIGSLLVYVLVLEKLGFMITTFVFLILSMLSFERRRWASAIVISLFTIIISYLVFSAWLKVQLPIGPFGI